MPAEPVQTELTTLEKLRAGQLAGSQRLDLSCGLTEFPPEIFSLADSLEILNLSGNALTSLPDDLSRLHKLRIIFCSDNAFTELPAVLGQCQHLSMIGFKANRIKHVPAAALPLRLRWLILTDNQIEQLPPEIGQCTQLQKLMLSGNKLAELPAELAECTQLELLRLASNRLTEIPAWLFAMPRLAWLALAGNPMTDTFEAATEMPSLPTLNWQNLTLKQKLGEGASGVIYQAALQTAESDVSQVAVKLFKSAVTSDGLPRSEMAACMAVGQHVHLMGAQGRISQHPEGVQGLVMPLIDASFKVLAGPPSLASCTRDVYAEDTVLSLPVLVCIALGVASAAQYLHAQRLLHGDLYAHNILSNTSGDCFLGDFGAASFLPLGDSVAATDLQRLEVRAFGVLLGELLAHCQNSPNDATQTEYAMTQLVNLQQQCVQASVSTRPLFGAIQRQLADLKLSLDTHAKAAGVSKMMAEN